MKGLLLAISMTALSSIASFAQNLPRDTYASCSVWQTTATVTKTPVPEQATGYCETGNEGGGVIKSCTLGVGAQAADLVLNPASETLSCTPLSGSGNPCAFRRIGPLVFNSEQSAQRTITTDSERIGNYQAIGQLRKVTTYTPSRIQGPFSAKYGRQFTVKRLRTATSVLLECKARGGEQIVFPVTLPGQPVNERIKFVGSTAAEPYDLLVYQVGR